MCTLTIFKQGEKQLITMNRDEQRVRAEAGLNYCDTPGQQTIFPVDSVSSGTWMGANQHHIVLCLLNRYHDNNPHNEENRKSRGYIIPQALNFTSYDDVVAYIQSLDVQLFSPFDLIVTTPMQSCQFSWNGAELFYQSIFPEKGFMITSSSVDTHEVIEKRKALFETLLEQQDFYKENTIESIQSNILKEFHLSQIDDNKSWSVLMERNISHTKSISQVICCQKTMQFIYSNEKYLEKLKSDQTFNCHNSETIQIK